GSSYPHARIGAPRFVTASACRFGRQSGSPVPRGDPHPDLHNDRPSNDWHGRAVPPDLPPKRLPRVTAPRTNGAGHARELMATLLRAAPAATRVVHPTHSLAATRISPDPVQP